MNYLDSLVQRLPPQNLEAETAVLGEMLMENSIIPLAKELLPIDFFYREAHRKIFSVMLSTYERDSTVDLITLAEELKKKGMLEEIGGAVYLSDLLNCAIGASMLEKHAEIIREKAIRRALIQRAVEIVTLAYGDEADLGLLLARYQETLSELLKKSAVREANSKLAMTLVDLKDYFSFCRETPFEGLNRAIGGCFGGELIIIGGRPGMGKTALVLEFLKKTAVKEGRPVAYFGAETAKPVIYARLLSSICKIPYNDLKRGKVNEEQAKKLAAAHDIIDRAPIYTFVIKEKVSAISLMAQVKGLIGKIKEGLGLIAIENLQQIFWPDKKFKRKEEVDVILESLKSFGLEIKVPTLLSCQINREPDEREDKRPLPSDLKETGQVEEIADKILFPFRPNYYEKKLIEGLEKGELIIAKGGQPISLPFKFYGEFLSWEEYKE